MLKYWKEKDGDWVVQFPKGKMHFKTKKAAIKVAQAFDKKEN